MTNKIIQIYNYKCFMANIEYYKKTTKSEYLFQGDIRKELIRKCYK